jgi:hypothetical protein
VPVLKPRIDTDPTPWRPRHRAVHGLADRPQAERLAAIHQRGGAAIGDYQWFHTRQVAVTKCLRGQPRPRLRFVCAMKTSAVKSSSSSTGTRIRACSGISMFDDPTAQPARVIS